MTRNKIPTAGKVAFSLARSRLYSSSTCGEVSPLHIHDAVEGLPGCVKLEAELDIVETQRAACHPPSTHPLREAIQVQDVLCYLHERRQRLLCSSCPQMTESPLSQLQFLATTSRSHQRKCRGDLPTCR